MRAVTSLLLITKVRNDAVRATASAMLNWLEHRGVVGRTLSADASQPDLLKAAAGVDAAAVLGGDGTFVGIGRKLIGTGIPLLGVNFGNVGFLTEVTAQLWPETFERLLKGRMTEEPRLTLDWSVVREGREIETGHAVNDVVAGRGTLARILSLDVRVNKQRLGRVRCDGMIVSTPAGTSGYALSAGGALVHPDLNALSLTAVSPFLSEFPPCVLPADCEIRLDVAKGVNDAFLTVDGQDGLPLLDGDAILIRGVPGGLIKLVADRNAYFRRLRDCGFIRDDGLNPLSKDCHAPDTSR